MDVTTGPGCHRVPFQNCIAKASKERRLIPTLIVLESFDSLVGGASKSSSLTEITCYVSWSPILLVERLLRLLL